MPAGRESDGLANRAFKIGATSWLSGGLAELPGFLIFRRIEFAGGTCERNYAQPVAAASAFEYRRRAWRRASDRSVKQLAEVSTRSANATLVSLTLSTGSANASSTATKEIALSVSASRREVRRHSKTSHAKGSQGDEEDPGAVEGHDAFLHGAFQEVTAATPAARRRNARLRPNNSQSINNPSAPSAASHGHNSVADALAPTPSEHRGELSPEPSTMLLPHPAA
jgi:hypothetical protein